MQTDIARCHEFFTPVRMCVNTIPVLNSRLMILIVRLMGKRTCLRLTYIRRIGHTWSEIAGAVGEREVTRITVRLHPRKGTIKANVDQAIQLKFNFVSVERRNYLFKLI